MSPRYAARCTELIDIDSHGGRMMSPRNALAAEAILPTTESFELTPTNEWCFAQTPRAHNMTYFVKTLEAEKYAKLLGRPQSQARATECLKLENLQKQERGWQKYAPITKGHTESCASLDTHACDWSVVSSEPNSPTAIVRTRMRRSLSAISTAASEEGSVRSDRETPLSKASRSVFGSFDEADCSTWGCLAEDLEYEGNSPRKLPLGFRRVMASMFPDGTNLTESVANLVGARMQNLTRAPPKASSKNVRSRATIAIPQRNVASPSHRLGRVPRAQRHSQNTRNEQVLEASLSNEPQVPAVAG